MWWTLLKTSEVDFYYPLISNFYIANGDQEYSNFGCWNWRPSTTALSCDVVHGGEPVLLPCGAWWWLPNIEDFSGQGLVLLCIFNEANMLKHDLSFTQIGFWPSFVSAMFFHEYPALLFPLYLSDSVTSFSISCTCFSICRVCSLFYICCISSASFLSVVNALSLFYLYWTCFLFYVGNILNRLYSLCMIPSAAGQLCC